MTDFKPYRATRTFHIGQIRSDIAKDTVVWVKGLTLQINGTEHHVEMLPKILVAGWLAPTEVQPQLPVQYEEPSPQEPNTTIPFASKEAAKVDGQKVAPLRQHVWESGWLNGDDGPTCKVCGVTLLTQVIRADRQRGNGSQQYHYRDALNNLVTSPTELSCPVFLGDPGSAAIQTKEVVRNVKHQVEGIDIRVESVEERLGRLEAENELLQQQLAARPVIDAQQVAAAFMDMLVQRAAQIKTGEGDTKYLPLPVLDISDITEIERILVPVSRDEQEP